MRIGHGFDVHAFGGSKPLIICGVYVPYHQGLIAHSDGDVALHAVTDAILGAAALGDIGKMFPDTNQDLNGIDSRVLIRKAWSHVQDQGYKLGNIDITLIAQEPKIAPYIHRMRINIANDFNTEINDINIKATTTENLGWTGCGKGIASEAIVLLFS